MQTTSIPSKMKMFNYGLIGFLVGFPGLMLAYNLLV
jgi:hypothetical protein